MWLLILENSHFASGRFTFLLNVEILWLDKVQILQNPTGKFQCDFAVKVYMHLTQSLFKSLDFVEIKIWLKRHSSSPKIYLWHFSILIFYDLSDDFDWLKFLGRLHFSALRLCIKCNLDKWIWCLGMRNVKAASLQKKSPPCEVLFSNFCDADQISDDAWSTNG